MLTFFYCLRGYPVQAARGGAMMCNVVFDTLRSSRPDIRFLQGGSRWCCPSCMPTLSLASMAYAPTSCCQQPEAIRTESARGMLSTYRHIVQQVRAFLCNWALKMAGIELQCINAGGLFGALERSGIGYASEYSHGGDLHAHIRPPA